MPGMITGKKTQQYSVEFKVKAVEWSHQPHRSVKGVAEALDVHPFMLSRWSKEHREGKIPKLHSSQSALTTALKILLYQG